MADKKLGIVKALDNQNRLVIPKDLRSSLGLKSFQKVEIIPEDNGDILVRKYEYGCCFCGRAGDFKKHMGKLVCCECREQLAKLSE